MKYLLGCLLILLVVNADEYQDKLAKEKKDIVMDQCHKDTRSQEWYSTAKAAELFVESMDTTFDAFQDNMPKQCLGLETRPKLIHSVGLVADGTFVSNGKHQFTGVFKGCENIVIRISLAGKPTTNPPNIAPGVGVKFMRDGMYSGNFVAMYQLAGQDSFNLFEHDWTNHVPGLNSKASLTFKAVAKKFRTASEYPYFVGLSDMAKYDQNGNEETSPKFPFRLVLHPASEVHNAFSSEPKEGDTFYLNVLDGYKVDTLFTVYAQPEPTSDDLIEIGEMKMTSAFDASKYSDDTLFYQHIRFEDDLKFRPDWEQSSKDIINSQESTDQQFYYQDLPWN